MSAPPSRSRPLLATLMVLLLLLTSGLVHGWWTGRWLDSDDLDVARERVKAVPLALGSWKGEVIQIDDEQFIAAGAKEYWMRRYQHAGSGTTVAVILMCGPSGQMSVHTPDVCYPGLGYNTVGAAAVHRLKDESGELRTLLFEKETQSLDTQLRVYWTWNASGKWEAPESPRFAFRGQAALYKLYILRDLPSGQDAQQLDTTTPLLQDFLRELRKSLFPAQSS